jgi:hypothetical protein
VVPTQQTCSEVVSVIEGNSLLLALDNGKEYFVHSGYAARRDI